MHHGASEAPYVLCAGRPGESYESLRGPFNLEGKPLLVDAQGPCDTPITGNVRVKVEEGTRRAWFVAYLPAQARDAAASLHALRAAVTNVHGLSLR